MLRALKWALLLTTLTMPSFRGKLFLGVALLLAACGTYDAPPQAIDSPITDLVVNKGFDQLWKDLTTLALLKSLPIVGYRKESGVMVLRLDHPSYVECSELRYATVKGRMRIAIEPLNDAQTLLKMEAEYHIYAQRQVWSFGTGEAVRRKGRPDRRGFMGSLGTTARMTCQLLEMPPILPSAPLSMGSRREMRWSRQGTRWRRYSSSSLQDAANLKIP